MPKSKVVLIMCDGMRADFVPKTTNNFCKFFLGKSVYTLNASTTMPSVTLPCTASLFFSVPPERHGILTNIWVPQVRPVKGLVEVLKEADKSTAFIYDWENIRDLSLPGSLSYSYFVSYGGYEKTMPRVVKETVNLLKGDSPDFIYVLLSLCDAWGHTYGFGTEKYNEAVSLVWESIEMISKAITDDYGLVVFADHGGHERIHGHNIPEDMTIPVILYGNVFKNSVMNNDTSIIDIAPTIVEAMGVKPDIEWEGKSLFRE